jgi:hypothetical protein
VLAKPSLKIEKSAEEGHLVLQDTGLYAVFQTSLPERESYWLPSIQWYTYARIMARGLRLTRTDDAMRSLIPYHEEKLDVQLRQSLVVLPVDMVEPVLQEINAPQIIQDVHPAENLFTALRGQRIGGVAIEACATYSPGIRATELVVVDDEGGYTVGLPSMEGLVSEEQLSRMPQVDSLRVARESVAQRVAIW